MAKYQDITTIGQVKAAKKERMNMDRLAREGKSAVTCGGCRYSHPDKIRGTRKPREGMKEKSEGVLTVPRCHKITTNGIKKNTATGKKEYKSNPNVGRYTDSDYCCGYGLPKPKPRKKMVI